MPSTRIKAVAFDMGGVLLEPDGDQNRRRWCERLGITADALLSAVSLAIGDGWEGGRAPGMIQASLASQLGLSARDAAQLLDDLHRDERLSPRLMDLVESVRPKIKVGILSNNGPEVRRIWNQVHQLDRRVDVVVISGEEGIAKPNPAIYELFAARLNTNTASCVFVDDSRRNVDGAVAAGMHAIHHQSAEDTVRAVLLLINGPRGS